MLPGLARHRVQPRSARGRAAGETAGQRWSGRRAAGDAIDVMRILFTAWAWPTHLHAMVPLARACRAAGDDVLMVSQPGTAGLLRRAGLPAAEVGAGVDAVPVFREIALSSRGSSGGGPRVLGLLTALAADMADGLIETGRDYGADLLVFEPTAFAGPLAAAVLGIPAVRHLYGTDLMSAAGQFLPGALAPLCDRLGVTGSGVFGMASIDPCPAGLQVPETGSPRMPLRYQPCSGADGGLPAMTVRGARPRVCVTWGTTLSRLDPGLFLAGQVARAAAGLDVDVVAAVTPGQRALLGPLPPGVQVAEAAPLHLVLPGCDAVVAHGGAASILTALACGLPQLLIPKLPDHARHAARVEQAGAGLVLPAPADEPGQIAAALDRLLSRPGYRAAARGLRDQMRAHPPAAQVAATLHALQAARA